MPNCSTGKSGRALSLAQYKFPFSFFNIKTPVSSSGNTGIGELNENPLVESKVKYFPESDAFGVNRFSSLISFQYTFPPNAYKYVLSYPSGEGSGKSQSS